MRLKIRRRSERGFFLWFPVVLVWIVVGAVMIAVLPFFVLGALLSMGDGPGLRCLIVFPLPFSLLWNLSGLHVETRDTRNEALISFD
jgi:hypothetical protein